MIAKNSESTIREAIESVHGLVDAIVVVDTGSTDATAEAAALAGADVVHFPWTGNFAEARNAALGAIGTDWVLVLDADEELDRAAFEWIRKELSAPQHAGYVVPIRNYLPPGDEQESVGVSLQPEECHPRAPFSSTYALSAVCRLFRRDPNLSYKGHVHEQVEYEMLRLGLSIGAAGFFIHHFGWYAIKPADLLRKRKLYRELLAQKMSERPDDGQVMVQYGASLMHWGGSIDEALSLFERAATLPHPPKDTWLHMGEALTLLGRPSEALTAFDRTAAGVEEGHKARLRAEALARLGRWAEARDACAEAVRCFPGYVGIAATMAILEIRAGDRDAGIVRLRSLIPVAEREASSNANPNLYLRAAQLHAHLEQWSGALALLRRGLEHFPDAMPLHEWRLKAGIATGNLRDAAFSAAMIAQEQPSRRAFLRLSAILERTGDKEASRAAHLCALQHEAEDLDTEKTPTAITLGTLKSTEVEMATAR